MEIRSKALYRFAILTAVFSVFLIIAGAAVTTTGSGDAVPDWPLSFGSLFPKMQGGVLFEHSHRLVGYFTGILIVILAIWISIKDKRKAVRKLAWWSLAAVVMQGVLGGLRVLVVSSGSVQSAMGVPIEHVEPVRVLFSVAHGWLAQFIICLIFILTVMLSPKYEADTSAPKPVKQANSNAVFGIIIVIFIMGQLLFGAMMRHTNAGLIIPDFPLSYGKLIPSIKNLRSDVILYSKQFNSDKVNILYSEARLSRLSNNELLFRVGCNFLHRIWAIAVSVLIVIAAMRSRKQPNTPIVIRKVTDIMLYLVICQVIFGMFVFWTQKSDLITTIHVGIGATLLGLSAIYSLYWKAIKYEPFHAVVQAEIIEAKQ